MGFGDKGIGLHGFSGSNKSRSPFDALRMLRAIRRAVLAVSRISTEIVFGSPAAGHEQAKRVEWLPGGLERIEP